MTSRVRGPWTTSTLLSDVAGGRRAADHGQGSGAVEPGDHLRRVGHDGCDVEDAQVVVGDEADDATLKAFTTAGVTVVTMTPAPSTTEPQPNEYERTINHNQDQEDLFEEA